jgi:hypothetical protein
MKLLLPYILFLFIFFFLNCNKSDTISEIPRIEFIGMNKTQMKQSAFNEDTLWLQFKFEDGDGDLGHATSDITTDIIVRDSRTGFIQDEFKLPELPPSENDAQKGVMTIRVFTTCCLFPPTPQNWPPCSTPPDFPLDSLQYIVTIRDRAGHESNAVYSDFVKLICR